MSQTCPRPDKFGRFRVRSKKKHAGTWSTRVFNPDLHVIVPGPASDSYGAELPAKPRINLPQADVQATTTNTTEAAANSNTESESK